MNDMTFRPHRGPERDEPQPSPDSEPAERREPAQRKITRSESWLRILALLACAMAILALNNLITETGAAARFKAVLAGLGAGGVAYAVNMTALKRGAYLGAVGYWSAGIVSAFAISFIGLALFASTTAGLILTDVAQLQLIERGQAQALVLESRIEAHRAKDQVSAAVSYTVSGLKDYTACENVDSCLSLKKSVGRGPVTRTLESMSARGEAIQKEISAGEAKAVAALGEANGYAKAYQDIIGKTAGDVWSRRSEAALIDAKFGQALSRVDQAMPLAAISSFSGELAQGTTIPGDPATTGRLNSILSGYADRLKAIEVANGEREELGGFPARPGVVTALAYLGHFAPLAGLVATIELILPLVLFFLRLIETHWNIERRLGRRRPPDDPEDGPGAPSAPFSHPGPAPDVRSVPRIGS